MTVTTTPKLMTNRQREFFISLHSRKTFSHLDGRDVLVINVVKESIDVDAAVTRSLASRAIDMLCKCPNVPEVNQQFVSDLANMLRQLPISKYALKRTDGSGTYDFFEVVQRRDGRRFINLLIGAPSDWRRKRLTFRLQECAARAILRNPHGAAVAYAKQHGRCAVCNSPLSDPNSIARSMGPVCAKRFN